MLTQLIFSHIITESNLEYSENENIGESIMLKTLRQKKLMQLLEQKGTVSVSELAALSDASTMTIRRDIKEFESYGIVSRVHGGVTLVENDSMQPSFGKRIGENQVEKTKIATEAAKRIMPGNVVFFDAGTTTLEVAKLVPSNISFTAITNSLMTAVELCSKPLINVITLGGEMHKSSYSANDTFTREQLTHFNGDLALISTKSLIFPEGLFESALPLIEVKRGIVARSNKVILLADYSKFGSKSLSLSIPFEDIDEIITDQKAPKEVVSQILNIGVKVTLAD